MKAVEKKRMRVIFSGRVQGVGFRYTVYRITESFSITGFVQNLWDGDVELVAEGTEQELVDFLQTIRKSVLGRNIVKESVEWKSATGEFSKFGISFE